MPWKLKKSKIITFWVIKNLTGNLTRKLKTNPILTILGSKNHFFECLEGWHVPGKAWQVPGMPNKLLLIGLETIKSEKTGVFGQKRGRFWSFWGPKVDQNWSGMVRIDQKSLLYCSRVPNTAIDTQFAYRFRHRKAQKSTKVEQI